MAFCAPRPTPLAEHTAYEEMLWSPGFAWSRRKNSIWRWVSRIRRNLSAPLLLVPYRACNQRHSEDRQGRDDSTESGCLGVCLSTRVWRGALVPVAGGESVNTSGVVDGVSSTGSVRRVADASSRFVVPVEVVSTVGRGCAMATPIPSEAIIEITSNVVSVKARW